MCRSAPPLHPKLPQPSPALLTRNLSPHALSRCSGRYLTSAGIVDPYGTIGWDFITVTDTYQNSGGASGDMAGALQAHQQHPAPARFACSHHHHLPATIAGPERHS